MQFFSVQHKREPNEAAMFSLNRAASTRSVFYRRRYSLLSTRHKVRHMRRISFGQGDFSRRGLGSSYQLFSSFRSLSHPAPNPCAFAPQPAFCYLRSGLSFVFHEPPIGRGVFFSIPTYFIFFVFCSHIFVESLFWYCQPSFDLLQWLRCPFKRRSCVCRQYSCKERNHKNVDNKKQQQQQQYHKAYWMSRMPQGSLGCRTRRLDFVSSQLLIYSQCSSLDFTGVLLIDHVWLCLHAEQSFRM